MYWLEPTLTIERSTTPYRPATGTRDNVRGLMLGPTVAGGSFTLQMSADEILEVLNIGLNGTPTITTPAMATNTRLHSYKPGALASMTAEYNDGVRTWQGTGYRANTVTFTGAADGDSTVSVDLFGQDLVAGTLTAALADRTPTFLQGYQTRPYVQSFASVPTATVVPGFLRNWTVTLSNGLDRVYTAGNTLAANRVIDGPLDVTASLTVDANSADALTEFTNWSTMVYRKVRIWHQDETAFIEGAFRRYVAIDVAGAWTAVNIGGSANGIRTYELTLQSIYEAATMAAMIQVTVQNARVAAFV